MFRKEAALLTACLCSAVAMAQDATNPFDALQAHTASSPEQSLVLPPDAAVEGTSFAQLTAKWWQWAFSMPIAPFMDPDGRLCTFNQDGPVWFLAGTDGTYTVQRKCMIPSGKYVLLPIINMIYNNPQRTTKKWKPYSCPQLQSYAAVNNDQLSSAVVMIDGVVIPDVARYRVRSDGCFHLSASPDANGKATPSSASDGYWILLKPLTPGRHTITVGANYGAAGDGYATMQQNFEYVIDVGGRSTEAHQRARGVGADKAAVRVGTAEEILSRYRQKVMKVRSSTSIAVEICINRNESENCLRSQANFSHLYI